MSCNPYKFNIQRTSMVVWTLNQNKSNMINTIVNTLTDWCQNQHCFMCVINVKLPLKGAMDSCRITVLLGGNEAVLFEPRCASSWTSPTLVLLHVSPTSRLPLSDSAFCQAAKPSSVLTVNVHYLAKKKGKNRIYYDIGFNLANR